MDVQDNVKETSDEQQNVTAGEQNKDEQESELENSSAEMPTRGGQEESIAAPTDASQECSAINKSEELTCKGCGFLGLNETMLRKHLILHVKQPVVRVERLHPEITKMRKVALKQSDMKNP